ncbi:hypothetical protein [Rummeliibacillus sp. SL167]|uniref:hypothetical protein n=1 Tax=Rummeliibacillus sp. SL167 TaxID=2579792 RepID=UPI0011B5756C|nr:hypothetical protein [Rummeliibacillus sp. SL167]
MISATACTTHAGERWGQQDVGHGVVATGRGALRLRSLIACAPCRVSSARFSRWTLNLLPVSTPHEGNACIFEESSKPSLQST